MKTTDDDRRVWIDIAALAGLSALLSFLVHKGFARYRPAWGLPKDQPGDTPAAPWDIPTPEEKAKAEPVRRTLDQAAAQVDTPEKADQVAKRLEDLAGNATTGDVEQAKRPQAGQPGTPNQVSDRVAESSRRIEQAAKNAPPIKQAADGIAQATKEVIINSGREREALSEATQETLNPEQQGAPGAAHPRQRTYLRQAVLKRMKPWDAVDAELFLAVNHLPHNRWLNGFFYFFTFTFSAGLGWYLVLALLALQGESRRSIRAVRRTILPLTIAPLMVEYPIKAFFRRRRPFIDVIQAVVIGKKPGSWSFPSGHSAAAFAGARLLSHEFPRQSPLLYMIAGLVAFSRIYLGDHYPGDVLSGSLTGMTIAEAVRRAQREVLRKV